MSRYIVYNGTDNIPATQGIYTSKRQCNRVIESLRERFRGQGYYRDNNWNMIAPEDIDYRIIPLKKGQCALDAAVEMYAGSSQVKELM